MSKSNGLTGLKKCVYLSEKGKETIDSEGKAREQMGRQPTAPLNT